MDNQQNDLDCSCYIKSRKGTKEDGKSPEKLNFEIQHLCEAPNQKQNYFPSDSRAHILLID